MNDADQPLADATVDFDPLDDSAVEALAYLLLVLLEQAREQHASRRRAQRAYLCRPQLLPDPHHGTPWRRLYTTANNRAFIATMGIDVETFHLILDSGFEYLWDTTVISRTDTRQLGNPRTGARSLDAAGALGLYLHWLCSSMQESRLSEIFALVPATVNRFLRFAEHILHATLKRIPDSRVSWPMGEEEFRALSQAVEVSSASASHLRMPQLTHWQARHSLLVGAFAAMDGLELPVQTSYTDPELENATYNGWTHRHGVGCVMVFAPDGTSKLGPHASVLN